MSVHISSRPFDGCAACHSAACRGAARSHRGPLDSRRTVRDGGAHRSLIDMPGCSAAQAAAPSGPRDCARGAIGTSGRVHSAVGGQPEETVQITAVQRAAVRAGMKAFGSVSTGIEAACATPPKPSAS